MVLEREGYNGRKERDLEREREREEYAVFAGELKRSVCSLFAPSCRRT